MHCVAIGFSAVYFSIQRQFSAAHAACTQFLLDDVIAGTAPQKNPTTDYLLLLIKQPNYLFYYFVL